jgi:hypothetical protein
MAAGRLWPASPAIAWASGSGTAAPTCPAFTVSTGDGVKEEEVKGVAKGVVFAGRGVACP